MKTGLTPPKGTKQRERLDGAIAQYRDFARSTDRVEVIDPKGTWEAVPPTGGNGQGARGVRITELGCKVIEFYAAHGLTQTVIARRLGMTIRSFGACLSRQEEVREAMTAGSSEMEDELSECLMGMARRGNVIAAIYLTKARLGWRDNDVPVEQKSNLQIVINAPLSVDDFKKMREAGVSPLMLPTPNPDLNEPLPILADGVEVQ